MATHSPARAGVPLLSGLKLHSRGKVRDTYLLPNDKLLLQVATDGISIFDFVLNALIPQKGIILNAMNHFWLQYLKGFDIKTHFFAAGNCIDGWGIPYDLMGNVDLQSRAMVVSRLDIAPVEFIARVVLTGSSIKSYAQQGRVCGHYLPSGLQDGDSLPYILDTPTTKAEEGHDENLQADQVRQMYPGQTYTLLKAFQIASCYAHSRGIKLADTKLEFGKCGTLGDEVFTPDSSRFWELRLWEEGRKLEKSETRKAPPPYDKQIVREWGKKMGLDKLDPKKPDDVARAHLFLPEYLVKQTTQTYRYIFWRLTGKTIESYLFNEMRVEVNRNSTKDIAIVCGSDSDTWAASSALESWSGILPNIKVHVMSCHRNPEQVKKFAETGCGGADVVIGVGSKALALPGMIDAFAYAKGLDIPVIGVALGELGSKPLEAAKLSIEELPGSPVIIDEITGSPYVGKEGLVSAIKRVMYGELPPQKLRIEKQTRMNIFDKS